jgi:DNA-binding protein YbaB
MAVDGPDWGAVLDPDSAKEQLAAWKGRIDQLAADTKTMSDRLERLRATGRDDDGLAEVLIDSTGVLVDLRLSNRIGLVSPETVSRAVLAAIQDARRRAAGQAEEIIARTVGTESPAARAIAERVGRQLRNRDATEGRG